MTSKLIKLTEETIMLLADRPKDIGEKIQLEIKLPEGNSINSFVLHGIITGCELSSENGLSEYLIEMKICEISQLNKKVLAAYMDYLERERKLKEASIDFQNMQKAMVDLKKRFSQLAEAVEQMKIASQGMLELIKRNNSGKHTIH
ncbi:MAG: hypothetical protein ACMUIU_18220 [bacterium]